MSQQNKRSNQCLYVQQKYKCLNKINEVTNVFMSSRNINVNKINEVTNVFMSSRNVSTK